MADLDPKFETRAELEAKREANLYASTVHGLRMQGWSRIDAEAEAMDRIERRRVTLAHGHLFEVAK